MLLKLQPYCQHTVIKRTLQKLAKRFFGPLKIIKRIEKVAYMLDLPSSSRILSVMHVSLLRPYFGSNPHGDFWPFLLQQKLVFLGEHHEEATGYVGFSQDVVETKIVEKCQSCKHVFVSKG